MMPFVVPKVTVYDQSTSAPPFVNVVASRPDPDRDQLTDYIEWLEHELEVAKVAFEVKTGEKWIEEPAT